MEIFCSTGGFRDRYFLEVAEELLQSGVANIELSGGAYRGSYEIDIHSLALKSNLMLHNYFPPPKNSFVFNLASPNSDIRKKSMRLAKDALILSSRIGSKFYAVHSGFCFDPNPTELGRTFKKTKLIPKEDATSLFVDSLRELSQFASQVQVKLLVENNVLTKDNLESIGRYSLLLTEPDEIENLLRGNENRFGLLLDVGHLKVSGRTIGFSPEEGMKQLAEFIDGYHLSDNNGEADQHLIFDRTAWFLNLIDSSKAFATIEIHDNSPQEVGEFFLNVSDVLGLKDE